MGALMIVVDMTIVNVALPSIGADLGFSPTALVWVVNAYTLTFGGFLLLGGRLGDLYGQRRMFLLGTVFFTVTSLVCGLAVSQGLLVAARALQGVGGAVVDAVALSLIVSLFTEPVERAKAMGIYGFVCAGGGSIGVLLGGLLTNAFSWHWIFLVNLPIGIAIFVACLRLLPADAVPARRERLDVGGALTITAALMVAVYAVIGGNESGWGSARTLALFAVALALLGIFVAIEARTAAPLVPLRLFRRRNIVFSNAVGILWSGGMFAWFFIAALYLQGVLGYNALEVGLAFLPANLVMAALSLGASAWLVGRYGIRLPLAGGLVLAGIGLGLFARAPVGGGFLVDVLPGMLLLGAGAGIAFNPLLLAAMSDVSIEESGLASGIVNTAS
jgi:EmrB/QacA subfamily drug resistance transporter